MALDRLVVFALCSLAAGAGCVGPTQPDARGQVGKLSGGQDPTPTFTNPVVSTDCADPAVTQIDGAYILTCTSAEPTFAIRESTDLVSWTFDGVIFDDNNRPGWADQDFFAPEIHRVGDGYIAYYSARDRDTQWFSLGAASASDPRGPYTDIGYPILAEDGLPVIDVTFFEDDDGTRYLLWKEDGNHGNLHLPTPIYIQQLDTDGVTVLGERSELIRNDLDWEGPLVEGPWMVKRGGYYYLFYSGNDFEDETYAVGVARSESPTSSFVKKGDPILHSSADWIGPGHCSVVTGPAGGDVMVHHAWRKDHVNAAPGRMTLLDPISWDGGWPTVGTDGTPIAGSQPLP